MPLEHPKNAMYHPPIFYKTERRDRRGELELAAIEQMFYNETINEREAKT